MPNSTARLFSTGNAPGKPRQTGQVFEFGGSPKRVEQAQNALVSVLSCTWTSRPMTGSWPAITSGEMLVMPSCEVFAIRVCKYTIRRGHFDSMERRGGAGFSL